MTTNPTIQKKVLAKNTTKDQRLVRVHVVAVVSESKKLRMLSKNIFLLLRELKVKEVKENKWLSGEDGFFYYLEILDPRKIVPFFFRT